MVRKDGWKTRVVKFGRNRRRCKWQSSDVVEERD